MPGSGTAGTLALVPIALLTPSKSVLSAAKLYSKVFIGEVGISPRFQNIASTSTSIVAAGLDGLGVVRVKPVKSALRTCVISLKVRGNGGLAGDGELVSTRFNAVIGNSAMVS